MNLKGDAMEEKSRIKWTTADEIKFLVGLGGWKDARWSAGKMFRSENFDMKRHLSLLFKYKASMSLRKKWGLIEPQKLLPFLP